MTRRKNIILAISFGLIIGFSLSTFSSPETGPTVTQRGVVNDDYYAVGGTVDIDAKISGDVVVSGGELTIGSLIRGDVITAGGTINIRGKVLDDVRAAGGEIKIDAKIGDDLIAAGGIIRVLSGSTTGGNAWLAGGEVHVAGTIKKNLVIKGGIIRLSGTVQGDVNLVGKEIVILEGARIEGNLYYQSPNKATIHPNAKINGKVTYVQREWAYSYELFDIFLSVTFIFAAAIMFLLFPGFTMSSAGRISATPWKSLGIGLALAILAPISAILLMAVVLGVWVGLSIFAFYVVALISGLLISLFFLGNWGAILLHFDITSKFRRLLSVAIAIIFLALIQFIPVIGGLLIIVLLLMGFGAGILQLHFNYKHSN